MEASVGKLSNTIDGSVPTQIPGPGLGRLLPPPPVIRVRKDSPASIPADRESTPSYAVRTCGSVPLDARVHAEVHEMERHKIFIR